jgi:hypothetical protein
MSEILEKVLTDASVRESEEIEALAVATDGFLTWTD